VIIDNKNFQHSQSGSLRIAAAHPTS